MTPQVGAALEEVKRDVGCGALGVAMNLDDRKLSRETSRLWSAIHLSVEEFVEAAFQNHLPAVSGCRYCCHGPVHARALPFPT